MNVTAAVKSTEVSVQATIDSRVDIHAKLVQEVQSVCLEKLAVHIDSSDTDLFATGILDSMSLVQLILELERHFEIELPIGEIEISSFQSVDEIASLLSERKFLHAI